MKRQDIQHILDFFQPQMYTSRRTDGTSQSMVLSYKATVTKSCFLCILRICIRKKRIIYSTFCKKLTIFGTEYLKRTTLCPINYGF